MTFSNGSTIAYTYDANGRKLRTVHNVGGTTITTDYAGNVIYENGVQKKLLTEEGYVDLTSGTYYYYLKDHQGNNRVVVNSGGTVTETNHYYPFGGTFASGTVQPYKYNGKELDTKAGLNWYDYGARHYDAALGRFTTQDPLAEKYFADGPYTYCGSNPVNRIDPTGMDWYEDSHGNMFWQEGHKDIEGYTNIGASATIGWGDDIFFNYYQNMGILGDSPANAVDLIASSPLLMQQAFGRNSGLSENSQLELFRTIQSRSKAGIGQAVGLFVVGELAGGIAGKAAGWALGKLAGTAVKGYTKSNLKLGQQMHKAYHAGEIGKEFRLPSGRRIDYLDINNGIIYELKPNNPRAIKQGERQLRMYYEELQNPATIQKFPMLKGINWKTKLDTY